MSAITIENDLVHYEVLGRGRPVIFVHGWLGSWRYWVPTMQQLSVKYRTYALDLWGFGDTGKDPRRYEFKDQVLLLQEFMDKLGITKAALVGHGLGAAICLRYASQFPDRAPRVALISAPLYDLGGLENGTVAPAPAAPVPVNITNSPTPATTTSAAPNPSTEPPPQITDTIPRNPFRGMGDTPEEILARLQAKNVISAAGLGTPGPQRPVAPSTPSLPTGIGTPILPREAPPASTSNTAPTAAQESAPKPATPPAPPALPAVPAAPTALPRTDVPNPLLKLLVGKPLELLTRYADRDAPDFDKLKAEVEKTDETVISKNAASFNGVNLAVGLQRMASPPLLLHGKLDPLVTAPSDDLIKRIYAGKPAGNLLAFVEDDLRHFPMLEITAKFNRLLMDFLDAQDLNNVQFKDQWRRTMR